MDEATIQTAVQETERISASFADESLKAILDEKTELSVVIQESEAIEGQMRALGVERYYNGAVGFAALAGETISAKRCITVLEGELYVLCSSDPDGADACHGITLQAGDKGAELVVMASGVLEDSSWSWRDRDPIYCGSDGRLTQTPPETGFSQIVALPLTATKILIKIHEAIIIEE